MKKKLLAIMLCVAMLAVATVSGTMAYFTDTNTQTNTFTAGKVDISLDEAVVEKDANGNLVAKGNERTSEAQAYHLYPAQIITKDPTITVAADSEDTYIAAVVTVTGDLYSLIGIADTDLIDINLLASGGLLHDASVARTDWNGLSLVHETDKCVIYQAADKENNTWVLYIFMKDVQVKNATITLFDTLTIPAAWDNAEMKLINGAQIKVDAYATQTNGFADCYTAVTTAFSDVFGDLMPS